MKFEDRARDAGRMAQRVGSGSTRPDLLSAAAKKRRRRLATWGSLGIAAVFAFVLSAPLGSGGADELAAPTTTLAHPTTTLPPSTTSTTRGECVVTVSTEAFVPPDEYPDTPPDLYDSAWVGTNELWTMVPTNGARWEGLPENTPGFFTQKVFWWTEGYLAMTHPVQPLVVTATNIHTEDVYVFEDSEITGGFNPDIGNFMLAGVDLPAGCWELTGTLRETSLSFVVEIVAS